MKNIRVILMVVVLAILSINTKAESLGQSKVKEGNYSYLGQVGNIKVYRENKFIGHKYIYLNEKEYLITKEKNVANICTSLEELGAKSLDIQNLSELVKDDLNVKRNVVCVMALIIAVGILTYVRDYKIKENKIRKEKRLLYKKQLREKREEEARIRKEFMDSLNEKVSA